MAESKTLLLLALAGAGGYYLYSKSQSTTTPTAASAAFIDTDPTSTAAAATGTDTMPSAAALAKAADSPALQNVPDDLAQLALKANVDLSTAVAVVKYDAIVYGHPDDLSTSVFLSSAESWAGAVGTFKASGIPELAQRSGIDPATALAVVALDANTYGHPTQLSTQVFLDNPASWAAVYANYKAANGLSGLAGGQYAPNSALGAIAKAMQPIW